MKSVSRAMATITAGRAAMSWVRQEVMPSGVPLASQMFAFTPSLVSWAWATAAHSCRAGISSVRLIRSATFPLADATFTVAVGPCQVGGCSICVTACLASATPADAAPDELAGVSPEEDPELPAEEEHAARASATATRPLVSTARRPARLTLAGLMFAPLLKGSGPGRGPAADRREAGDRDRDDQRGAVPDVLHPAGVAEELESGNAGDQEVDGDEGSPGVEAT